ncbi:hypothetical protein Taro_007541 [Colocasia esculenta]|uniref:non-specific serine/threonine protein kinase n=1 Tax=Colocasia esculenta TaxID=4460 RepID=A0A843TVQ0_COLES|nr:hypothetical protein [Colocasia esculenta]
MRLAGASCGGQKTRLGGGVVLPGKGKDSQHLPTIAQHNQTLSLSLSCCIPLVVVVVVVTTAAAAAAAAAAATTTTTLAMGAVAKMWRPTTALGSCLCLLLLLLVPPSQGGDTDPNDVAAMVALAKSITPLPSKWSTDPASDPCVQRWAGVSCSSGHVTSIDLQGTSLRGQISHDITKLSSLASLSLQRNQLSGPLPTMAGLTNLREIYLGNNGFESVPSDFFSGLSSLVNVSLDHNPFFPWTLPTDLGQCASLAYFSAMNASIVGAVPNFFDGLLSLQSLRLSYNHLSGELPVSLGSSNSIRELYFNNQLLNATSAPGKLSGTLVVLGSMTQLEVAWVHGNNFTGPIPDLSKCTSLSDLQLRDNQLTGVVPQSLSKLPKLANLTLSNNLLQGPFPSLGTSVPADAISGNSFCKPQPGPCDQRVTDLLTVAEGFGYPLSFASSWKGNDPCNGWLFVVCNPQGNITNLNFGGQNLVGNISEGFSNFAALKVLRLQHNSLSGDIPPTLTKLSQLQLLDVSYNNLTGDVPTFASSVKVITDGNPLLGTHTGSGGSESSGSAATGSSPSSSGGTSSGESRSMPAGYIVLIVLLVLAVAVGSAVLFYKKHKNRLKSFGKVETHSPPSGPEMVKVGITGLNGNSHFGGGGGFGSQGSGEHGNTHLIDAQSMYIPIQDLRRATNNFNEGNILGSGGFGVVYKGEQPDGTLIAVKRMECTEMGKKGMGEFKAEIEVLKKVRHRHLVALLGYCEHENEKLLVYEYMPQGTLGQHLFRGHENEYPPLTWKQRLTVALDVARGLEYLHSLAQTSFIHRDLKPSNILLDNDMRAKVSDFGLVKLAPDGKNSVQTRLAGTFGYLAPEYATTGRVTTKVDVYAFGVVLMELITGRKALDESLPDESTHLVSWFRRVLINKDNIKKAVDARLDLSEEDFNSLSTVSELAGHCTSREAHQRPDMGHAVNVLVPLVGQWKPSCSHEEDGSNVGYNETLSQRVKRWQQNEGTSLTGFNFDSNYGMDNSQGSIPSKSDVYPDAR